MPKKLQRKLAVRSTTAESQPAVASGQGVLASRRVSNKLLTEFTSQLAVLLDAGIPVTKSLRILQGQMPPGALRRGLVSIVEDVEGGTSLSEALGKYPQIFDGLYTNMVRAGEIGGVQDVILNRLSDYLENQADLKSRVRGALAYPIAVVVLASVVLVLVFIFVIPKFKEIFISQFGSAEALPAITQLVINTGEHLQNYWWVYLLLVALVYVSHVLLVARVQPYRRFWHTWVLRIPLFGLLAKKALVARFSRTFGTLIQSGVPHLEALDILSGVLPNERMREAVTGVHHSIREGSGIAQPLADSDIFDDIVVNMVDVGEQTGELDRMLGRISDRYELDVRRTVDSTFRIIEPVLLVVMAVLVGVIVFALFMPLLKLMEKIS